LFDVAGTHRWLNGSTMNNSVDVTKRIARSVQTTVGWIFWDPGAVARYVQIGIPEQFAGPLGYIAARCTPLAAAGPEAVTAAFGSISPIGINGAFAVLGTPEKFQEAWNARNAAVIEGLHLYAPGIVEPLVTHGPALWQVVEQLPLAGRVLFGAHLAMPRPTDPLLSGWHAVNCLREWRGDTHWAITVAEGLTHAECSILHNAWMGYETDWIANSRGTDPDVLGAGWESLNNRKLARDRRVLPAGFALRQRIEDRTDALTTLPWELFGIERTLQLAEQLEPPCELLLHRVDITAGPNYQPASRIREVSVSKVPIV